MITKLFDISGILLTFALSLLIIATLNAGIVFLFMGICLLSYFIEIKFNRKNIELNGKYPPFTRKLRYLTEWMQEYQFGKDLRLYELKGLLSNKYYDSAENVKSLDNIQAKTNINKGILLAGVALINEIALYVYLIYSFINGSLSIGEFTMYVIAIRTFCSVFTELITALARVSYLSNGIGIIRNFLDYTSEDLPKPLGNAPKNAPFTIEFINVFFKYPHQEDFILKDISIKIEGFEKLALVGMNGAGKTTFVKLMMGLYLPTKGEILINGKSTATIERKELYRMFSVVFQEVELFAMTLAENISMCPHSESDMKRIEDCIDYVGLSEMVYKLPDKLDTMVTKNIFEGGVDFSGGQRQRLAIARALYKDQPILILDEPTAALDAFAENEIYALFSNMTVSKTCVFISHRLSSVIFCDKVLLLDSGEIAEYGTHDSLMQIKGKYHELFSLQAKYYIDEVKGGEGL